jgi:ribosomal protein L16 Arg81 hydroxylase
MIPDWLLRSERDAFLKGTLGRRPYAQAATAQSAIALLSWKTLDAVLGAALHSDVLTVQAGRLVAVPVPRSSEEVRALMARRISTVIRASERHDPGLRSLAEAFGACLPGQVHVQLYATPGGTHSFSWHYDLEDVFVAQTLGTKDYYMRENTVARRTRPGNKLDFTCFRQESSPILLARLVAGDWLYIPQRWWHLVKCVEDSLSISVGVMPPE